MPSDLISSTYIFATNTLLVGLFLGWLLGRVSFVKATKKHLNTINDLTLSQRNIEYQLTHAHSNSETILQDLSDKNQAINGHIKDLILLKESQSMLRTQLASEREKVQASIEEKNKLQDVLEKNQSRLSVQIEKNAQLDKNKKGVEVSLEESIEKERDLHSRLALLQSRFESIQHEHNELSTDYAELKASLHEREKSHHEKLRQLDESKLVLKKEFENIANKIFEEKGKTFTYTNKESVNAMLKPFKEQIEGFQKRINDVHDSSIKGQANLNAEIKKVLDVGLKISDEANNLTSALKGDSQKRGAWGEEQLQRTLEISGLIEDTHFVKQSAFKDTEEKRKQTDYIVQLPGDKHIIIDSKVSLVAYDKTVSAETEEAYAIAMDRHTRSVKAHIDDLASKDYTNLVGMRSPNFVLMYMPIEPAYIEALKNNKDLFNYGYDKGIVLVSHTTLLPILRTVANLWVMEQSTKEAREISDRAGEIYNSVCTVAERLQKLGGTLATASNQYNQTVTSIVGQQGLHGKVERFTQLSSKVSKSLPSLESKYIDFEYEKLSAVEIQVDEY